MDILLGLLFIAIFESTFLAFAFVASCQVFAGLIICLENLVWLFIPQKREIVFQKFQDKKVKKKITSVVDFLCSEWVFRIFPNGGTAVVVRTIATGTIICVISYLIFLITNDSKKPPFEIISNNLYKILTIYAAVYAAFYARFVSQWNYLTNLYNSIKEQDVELCDHCNLTCNKNPPKSVCIYGGNAGIRMKERKADFILDAINLHLEKKHKFSAIIYNWLVDCEEIAFIFMRQCPEWVDDPRNALQKFRELLKSLRLSFKDL